MTASSVNAGGYAFGEANSFLYEYSRDSALNSARYLAKNKAELNCKKMGGEPSYSQVSTIYFDGNCWSKPNNAELVQCSAGAQILCTGLPPEKRIMRCAGDRDVPYELKLIRSWSNKTVVRYSGKNFSYSLKLSSDEFNAMESPGPSDLSDKAREAFVKVNTAICGARPTPTLLQQARELLREQVEKSVEKNIKACKKQGGTEEKCRRPYRNKTNGGTGRLG